MRGRGNKGRMLKHSEQWQGKEGEEEERRKEEEKEKGNRRKRGTGCKGIWGGGNACKKKGTRKKSSPLYRDC